jgi:tetratricopeptide (TPR) repeat protein
MHISLLPPSSPPEARVRRALLESDLAWLREELSGTKSPEQRASILHQLGLLELAAGRDAVAVRQLLAAVNSVAFFKEPLERLLVLIERRRSFKNLPTLLEHACRSAEGNEEVARAQLASAWCALQHGHDEARASARVEAALEASPRDPAALLSLELLARRLNDEAGTRRALAARLAQSSQPAWSALLALELAERIAADGDHERANTLLEEASRRATTLGFAALEQRFELGRAAQRSDWMIDSLAQRATRVLAALEAPDLEQSAYVPLGAQSRAYALDALLLQAQLEQAAGHDSAAWLTLERAAQVDAAHPLLVRARIDLCQRSGQHELGEELLLGELGHEPTGAEAIVLWLELSEARAASGRHEAALDGLQQAIALDPRCWLARARELELLSRDGDAQGRARSLVQIAQSLADGAARGRHWLLAADAFARQTGQLDAARDAIERAEKSGVPSPLARRVERALAHASEDRRWYHAATERLLAGDLEDSERIGLELEAWRHAVLAGDDARARAHLDRLDAPPAGRRVARLARAYAPNDDASGSGAALAALAELESSPARAAALGWALSLRASTRGERHAAVERLAQVHAQQPGCAAVAGTPSAWLHPAEPLRAAAVLRATARAIGDGAFAASLLIEAGLAGWWAGEREAALLDFAAAERPSRSSRAGALSGWARRASGGFGVEPDSVSDPEERVLGAIERATRGAAGARELNELNAALRAAPETLSGDLSLGARLSSLFLGRALGMRADPSELERVASTSANAAQLVAAFRYLECIGQTEPSPRALEECTRRWSEGGGGLLAALEWTAAAARLGQRRVECAARRRVSELSSGALAEQARASAALVAHLSQAETAEFLEGRTPALLLTNLETSPPGCDPRRRSRALEGAAELFGSEAEPILGLLRGYNQLAAGDVGGAIGSFRRYTDAFPDDPSGWEGVLAAARRCDDPALLAEAAARLGNTCRDPAHAARLFEEAAEIFFDRLGDEVAGQTALMRAVQLDASRSSSFWRLYRSLRDSAGPAELLNLLDRRSPFATDPAEQVELSWERARAARLEDDLDGALAALSIVIEHDPRHLGALVLFAEIFVSTQRYAEAVDRLAQLAASAQAPPQQRLASGLMAADLCEIQLDAPARALQILGALEAEGLSNLALRERQARSAASAGAWSEAAGLFERLMHERTQPEERAEAARLALVIHRDHRHDPGAAGAAVQALLGIVPSDAEALDLVLSGALERPLANELLLGARSELIRSTSRSPTDADALQRLARVAEQLGDAPLRQATVGALVALGHAEDASRAELVSLERRISTIPPLPVSSDVLAELADPDDTGPFSELLALVAPYLADAFGPPRHAFALNRKERISARSGEPLRDEIAAWVHAFALSDFDLYLSPVPSERLVVLETNPLTVIVGASVTAPLGPFQRLSLARSLYAAKRGLGPLIQLEQGEVLALIAALCSVAGVELAGPPHARQRDFERQLSSLLPRKARKGLQERARPVREEQARLDVWVRAVTASLDRVSAVAVGDASVILADAPARDLTTPAQEDRARRLLSFMLSPEFQALRERFGVSVR